MDAPNTTIREIALPVSVFHALKDELFGEAGVAPTTRALHQAGYRAGNDAVETFTAGLPGGVLEMGESAFWSRLEDFFSRRGWGALKPITGQAKVGLLVSEDWAEATPNDTSPEASCSFTTGFMSGLLSQIAGGPVAVLEVSCRTRGDDACRFGFGSERAITDLHGLLLDGADLDSALADG
jgi:predicted hydrocarbon binding protein